NKDRVVDESELAEEARRLLAEAEAADAREDALAAEEQAARRGLLPAGFTSEEERRARLDAAAKRLAKARQPAAEAPAAEEGQQQPETAKVRGRALASVDAASATVPIPTAASCARAPVSSRATTRRWRSARRTSCSPAPSRKTTATTARS